MQNNRTIIITTFFVLAVLLVPARTLLAHGDEKHAENKKMSPHMQAMYALKDKIPAEYRLMERTPIHPDEESLTRGKELYAQQCAVCHGETGRGDGPAASGMQTKPANFLDREHSAIYGPGEKFWIIGNGSGETGMPPFPQVDLVDRWHLVNHILSLQRGADDEAHKHH